MKAILKHPLFESAYLIVKGVGATLLLFGLFLKLIFETSIFQVLGNILGGIILAAAFLYVSYLIGVIVVRFATSHIK